ncbi:Pentatricopeptide repeat-containing protein [Musa troglodytarum]|uniref:Pentatricopeptide repeat-containing protein n=1 Tax=Musa troglodytarum TaxID=320322 RepID=A0A9E7FN60_9LILI|nr:Pentatricopeptide repeat-containing protein [Musa troglodytarum]
MSRCRRSSLLLQLLEKCQTMRQLKQTQARIVTTGLAQDAFALSRLLAFCSHPTHGSLGHAHLLFRHIHSPTLCVRNTMIKAFLLREDYANPFEIYSGLLRDGLFPDNYTFPYVLKTCAGLRDLRAGAQVHSHVVKLGFCSDTFVGNTLALMYIACGDVSAAREAFDGILQRDAASWTVMISGYSQLGDVETARMMFDESPVKDRGIWGAVISAYVHNNCFKEGLSMFRLLQAEGLEPDEGVLVSALCACAQTGAVDIGSWIHHYVNRVGFAPSVRLGTALVDMYLKCGYLNSAKKVFDGMTCKDTVCWNVMILGLAMHGNGEGALELFTCMKKEGLKPDDATFVAVLSACSHSGMVEEGLEVFKSMRSLYRVEPRSEHYVCVVDFLGRAGRFQEAKEIIEGMPHNSSPAERAMAWRALLSACRNHTEARWAEVAAGHLLELEDHSGVYVLLSSIYDRYGKQDDARRMRNCMKLRGVPKMPGCSSIQLGRHVHEFVAGEQIHPGMKEVYGVLETMNEQFVGLDY